MVDSSKSQTLVNATNDKFVKDGIYWPNVISVGLDNTNANMRICNSVKSCIIQKSQGPAPVAPGRKNLDCLIAGFNCHLAYLVASRVGAAYQKVEYQVDLYYFFNKSNRKKFILADYMEFFIVRNGRK